MHRYNPSMTISGLIERLRNYPADELCLGTFWLKDDFLALDSSLTREEIEAAMEIAWDMHDANIGFNWDTLQAAIDVMKGE